MASDCIFCKIVAGEIPATVVKRTDRLLAFRDVGPQAPVHILVIPTEHIASLAAVQDGRLLGDMLMLARDIAADEKIAADGYRVVLNTNRNGGQTVFHLHLHLLGGRRLTWPPG
ncbi:MAG TPA: histidine triad nucleotide-binding protein [Gemmatimonadales bacterium]|nr:histidine triad nucleotide-binding protein [Gemmatimonadales bacterium]